jgi:hypothetical protein|tara:strand:+ start:402 stop:758 length:357 start_codon:yes stop_codon:yes gene_type:complete
MLIRYRARHYDLPTRTHRSFNSPAGLRVRQGLVNTPADVVHSVTCSIQAAASLMELTHGKAAATGNLDVPCNEVKQAMIGIRAHPQALEHISCSAAWNAPLNTYTRCLSLIQSLYTAE